MAEGEPEEGPRSFARFLEQVADGDCQLEMSDQLFQLVRKMQSEAKGCNHLVKGELELKLKLAMEPNGVVTVAYETKRREPTPQRSKGVMFVTEGGNLSVENPRQKKLPLRDVTKDEADEVRDVGPEETREV